MKDKYIELKQYISKFVEEGLCIAFSGGVDSSLILKVASDISKNLHKKIYAVTFDTKLHPVSDIAISKRVAEEMGVDHEVIELNEFNNKDILKNPINRCYLCKRYLFETLLEFAKDNNVKHVLDGTNADDLKVYRPGVKALSELGIISPLADLGITKEEVRKMAVNLNISVAERPSTPCMATRLPYNTEIDFELLKKIEKSEEFIKSLGFNVVRVRVHDDIVRIEVNKEDFIRLVEDSNIIIKYLKDLGFTYITLDIEGFRSGSMDIHLHNN